ncbi:ankyrin repeat domain-containing protein [Candidatus Dependentiae bacterium]|nr:ankyrin repeat domain-containing protein [Candidatus Dependentiae bacterium]
MNKLLLLLLLLFIQVNATGLTDAVQSNNKEKVEQLLAQGADINEYDHFGFTPIYWAAIKSNTEMLQLLIEKGADFNKPNNFGTTPLHWGAYKSRTKLGKLLIQAGANVDKSNNDGETPLHWAAKSDNREIVQLLMNAGANPFIKNIEGNTALFTAAQVTVQAANPERKQGIQTVLTMLKLYMSVFREVQESPTYDTLRKMVERECPGLVKQLLKWVMTSPKDPFKLIAYWFIYFYEL